jgi:hypothetical protein
MATPGTPLVNGLTNDSPAESIRDKIVSVKVTATEKELLEHKATTAGKTLSDWLRDTTIEVPAVTPPDTIREAVLREILTEYSTELAVQYKHFLQLAEALFMPLADQLMNHREWMKGTLQNFSAGFKTDIEECQKIGNESVHRANEIEQRFYSRWLWLCLGAFGLSIVLGVILGKWWIG